MQVFKGIDCLIDYSFFSHSTGHVFQQVLVKGVVVKTTSSLGPRCSTGWVLLKNLNLSEVPKKERTKTSKNPQKRT